MKSEPPRMPVREQLRLAREALRQIASLRPLGPTRNKLAMRMERIAIDAIVLLDKNAQ